jgi:hypothetical protein
MTWMLRNSRGRPDALLTFAAGAVVVAFVKVLLHGVVAFGMTFGSIDAATIAALLTPTLGAYTAKRIGADKGSAVLPPSSSSTLPVEITTRGAAGYALPGLVLLLAIGFGIYLVAMAHRGAP